MKKIIKTQIEWDKIPKDFDGTLEVVGKVEKINSNFNNAIINISGSANIDCIYSNVKINYIFGYVKINSISDLVYINYTYGKVKINSIEDSVKINTISDTVKINYIFDTVEINTIKDNVIISCISDKAKINSVYGKAVILDVKDYASVTTYGYNIIRYNETEKNIKIKASKNTIVVVLKEKKLTFKEYKKYYPVETKKTKAIFYKAVRKINGCYCSDYNNNYRYKIGETVKEKCDNNLEKDCSYGIHIAPLDWCIKYGRIWENLAILEVETNIKDIIIPKNTDGKIRTSSVKILKEIKFNK